MSTENSNASPAFTPGPWTAASGPGWKVSVTTSAGAKIRQTTDRPLEERQANALLIAAAPDLYGALESALQLIEDLTPCVKQGSIADYQALNEVPARAHAALRKATDGGQ